MQLKDDEMRESLIEPPNIQVCLRQMTPNTPSNPTLLSSFGVNTLEPSLSHCQNTYAHTIKNLWSLYSAINSGDKSVLLDRMIAERMTRKDIEILIEPIALPILEALDELKLNPLVHWSKDAYIVIGRDDIYKQLQMKVTVCDPNTDTFKLPFLKVRGVFFVLLISIVMLSLIMHIGLRSPTKNERFDEELFCNTCNKMYI